MTEWIYADGTDVPEEVVDRITGNEIKYMPVKRNARRVQEFAVMTAERKEEEQEFSKMQVLLGSMMFVAMLIIPCMF